MNDIELFQEDEPPVPEEFVIDSLEKAEWALRQKGRAEDEIERFTAMAKQLKAEYSARIDDRLAQIVAPHIHTADTMTEVLLPWSNIEVAKAHGKKSVKLLSGTVGFRKSPSSLNVTDEAKAVAWLEDNGHEDCVRVKKEVKKAETKKLIEEKGELPDGAELKDGGEVFYAEPLRKMLEDK